MILLCKLLIFDNQTEVFPKRRHKSNFNKFHNYTEACGHALITRALAQAFLSPKESMRPLKQLTRSSRSLEDLSCRTLANLSWLVSNSYFHRGMHVLRAISKAHFTAQMTLHRAPSSFFQKVTFQWLSIEKMFATKNFYSPHKPSPTPTFTPKIFFKSPFF